MDYRILRNEKENETKKKKIEFILCVWYCTTATVKCICPRCTCGDDEML